jgi:hypothetical protein
MTSLGRLLRRGAREPAVHFVVLGLVLFAVYRAVSHETPPRRVITLSPREIAGLREDHRQRFGAPPTPDEEAKIVARLVDEELLYREALALGLDRGDIIVRRRMVQKMEFLGESAGREPTRQELEEYLSSRPDRYREAEALTFEHVFVGRDRHADAEGVLGRIAEELRQGEDPGRLGDPFLRGREFAHLTEAQIAALLGTSFAREAAGLGVGVWSPPIASSYGLHLVRIRDRHPARVPDLADVRARVLSDLRADRHVEGRRAQLHELRARYDVRIAGRSLAMTVTP